MLEYRPDLGVYALNEWRYKREKARISRQSNTTASPITLTSTLSNNNNTRNSKTNSSKDINHKCEPASISEFPRDFFTQKQRKHGAFLVHVLVSVYMCVALAIVCDYYFVPSLEVLCYKLDMQSDVAGATLMAVGSSAPELFASIIGKHNYIVK